METKFSWKFSVQSLQLMSVLRHMDARSIVGCIHVGLCPLSLSQFHGEIRVLHAVVAVPRWTMIVAMLA